MTDRALNRFDTVSLDEAIARPLLSRIDTKIVVPVRVLPAILTSLPTNGPSAYRVVDLADELAPAYTTRYFDTPDLSDYLDHHNGRRIRQKFRYRRYHSTNSVFFEVKQRSGANATSKTRIGVGAIPAQLGHDEASLIAGLGLSSHGYVPSLEVLYRRVTFVGVNDRLTVDMGLQCRSPNGRSASFDRVAILEMKQEQRSSTSVLTRSLREHGLRPFSVSKYCMGIASCNTDVKRNRFDSKIRLLQTI